MDGFPKRSCTQRNPSPVGSAPSVVRSLSANFHRASHENNRFSSSGSALVAKTLNERLFVQLEAVYGDGRGHMEHGLIKVVAVLPFCKEVLSRQRSESGVAKPNRMQSAPGLTGVITDGSFPHRAAVRIHALVRTLIIVCQLGGIRTRTLCG